MANGTAGEAMIGAIITEMGFPDISNGYDRAMLLSIAHEARLENVEKRRREAGKVTNWNITSSKLIIDWVFGLDWIMCVDGTGRKFGFDFTTDPAKISQKVQKMKSFKPSWKKLGVEKVGVVLLIPSKEEWGLALLSSVEREAIEDALYENIFLMDESEIEVMKLIVSW
jgi:hypothetical protein